MNALRGALLVIVALVIAVVILARGLDDAETTNVPVGTTGTTETSAEPPAAPPPPAADEPAPSAPAAPAAAEQPAPTPPSAPTSEPAELPEAAPDDMFAPPAPPATPTHNRADVKVLVANGTDVCGAAGRLATSLSAQGYNVLPAVNAESGAEISAVFYVDEYGADAGVVASLLRVPSSQVLPMPASPPTAPGDAHVVIHIGADDLAQPNC